jgi:flagellar motility protein MotE (MotC chaperone)
MGKRLLLIILAVAGIAVFAVSFVVSRGLISPAKTQAAAPAPAEAPAALKATANAAAAETQTVEEKHLYDLVKEVREKVRECQKREQELEEQEKRMQITRQVIDREAQNLEAQRLQLAAALTRVKETRVAIDREEVVNLKRVAAVYDKMDATAGGRILEGMCTNKQESDAVKILHYMQERSVAKVLAEITDKNLAARLCEQLKRVKEQS